MNPWLAPEVRRSNGVFAKGYVSPHRAGEFRSCVFCGAEFYAQRCKIKEGKAKYCSAACSHAVRMGQSFSPDTEFKKGRKGDSLMLGRKHSQETRAKMRDSHASGPDHHNWKGGVSAHRSRYIKLRQERIRAAAGSHTRQEWEALKAASGFKCVSCHAPEAERKLSKDHIVPLARGGHNSIGNIQPLCMPCNVKKGAKTIRYGVAA